MHRAIPTLFTWAMCVSCCCGQQAQYRNPVFAGDYPDPSVIRVGDDYWATATSSEWGPQFPILHSRDLVNWEIVGSAFPERPTWAVGDFWAPEITYYKNRYFIYYVGRNREDRLAVAVATSNSPKGPYKDHGQLVAQDAGSIDAMAFTDQEGQRWMVWKEDGNSRNRPTLIWLQRLSEDGLTLVGQPHEILRNDAEWEGLVVEGPFIFFRDGWHYLFYAGADCCGRDCNSGVGVARARSLHDRWEKCPANPILAENSAWRCPGHGSVVQDPQGRHWLLYHAYSADTFVATGREMLLDEITWGQDDWPRVGRDAPNTIAAAPLGTATRKRESVFREPFDGDTLRAGWLWPQERVPSFGIDEGVLVLKSPKSAGDDLLGAVLARACTSGNYRATAILDLAEMNDETLAGIAAMNDSDNGLGLVVNRHRAIVWQRQQGQQRFFLVENRCLDRQLVHLVHLRIDVSGSHQMVFSVSDDGKNWKQLGDAFDGGYMPPWDGNIRVALTAGQTEGATARFQDFTMESAERRQVAGREISSDR